MAFRPLVISHAGCGGHAPPDTLAGVRKAIELGADAIEVDVQVSAEGVPVVIHDDTVDSTTDGTGKHPPDPAGGDQQAQRRRALPGVAGARDRPDARASGSGSARQSPAGARRQALRHRGRATRCAAHERRDRPGNGVVDPPARRRAVSGVSALDAGGFGDRRRGVARSRAVLPGGPLARGAQLCTVHHCVLTRELAHRARLLGLGPYAWTVNEEADMRRMLDCGVAGIITDYPDRLINLLDELAL